MPGSVDGTVAPQNAPRATVPVRSCSATINPVMRNPEMAKKTSTPIQPPSMSPVWNATTNKTDNARRPSRPGR